MIANVSKGRKSPSTQMLQQHCNLNRKIRMGQICTLEKIRSKTKSSSSYARSPVLWLKSTAYINGGCYSGQALPEVLLRCLSLFLLLGRNLDKSRAVSQGCKLPLPQSPRNVSFSRVKLKKMDFETRDLGAVHLLMRKLKVPVKILKLLA